MLNVDRMRKANAQRQPKPESPREMDGAELFAEILGEWLSRNGTPEPGSMKYHACVNKASQETARFINGNQD